jgi:hypothetical protein
VTSKLTADNPQTDSSAWLDAHPFALSVDFPTKAIIMRDLPCRNCRRLHFGPCRNEARTCWDCGSLGHIQRYCPERPRRLARLNENLEPGSWEWCTSLGLNNDPPLMNKILATIIELPGSTIYVNDECIYRGNQTHFYRS